MNALTTKTCAHCAAPYTRSASRYCSPACKATAKAERTDASRIDWTCARCGKPERRAPSDAVRVYCSVLCAQKVLSAERVTGLRPPARRSRHPWTHEQDEELQRDYCRRPTVALAKRFGCTADDVKRRARLLGLMREAAPRGGTAPRRGWTSEEDAVLRTLFARAPLAKIANQLGRTSTAVSVRAKRLGLYRGEMREDLTARGAAELLGIEAKRVVRLIEAGHLKGCVVPGQGRVGGAGGQRWSIQPEDLRAFILEHPAEVNMRKVGERGTELINLVAGRW